jgi:hypothetical protein
MTHPIGHLPIRVAVSYEGREFIRIHPSGFKPFGVKPAMEEVREVIFM